MEPGPCGPNPGSDRPNRCRFKRLTTSMSRAPVRMISAIQHQRHTVFSKDHRR
ncbi:hypothetical protein LINGRAHAP2_LOCUS18213, partial [Linum grandiflorum]